ncbi:VOC family protein [Planctobacterium marinum]|uniref:VOC family protein n=1 Tax=Planctobacterium marinum TaxID=1631968 RepID=UPI001E4351D6|nr:VOC family protein [Planctobacterium marinum]MCC2606741.1 VOC family protein [Planctobacterium marinum]
MIGYVTLGTADLQKSGAYYDALLATIGAARFMEEDNYFIAWSKGENEPAISVTLPFNKEAATAGNGTMVAVVLESPEQVDAFYHKALELGGSCEGKPGFRPEDASAGFYAGYFRDLDGNKLNAFCMVPAA